MADLNHISDLMKQLHAALGDHPDVQKTASAAGDAFTSKELGVTEDPMAMADEDDNSPLPKKQKRSGMF